MKSPGAAASIAACIESLEYDNDHIGDKDPSRLLSSSLSIIFSSVAAKVEFDI